MRQRFGKGRPQLAAESTQVVAWVGLVVPARAGADDACRSPRCRATRLRALEQRHLMPTPAQLARGCQTHDSTADDDRVRHAPMMPALVLAARALTPAVVLAARALT